MSKITFRADDELITRLEEFDASKSEIMREALREYLDENADARPETGQSDAGDAESLDDLVTERVDAIIADRLDGTFTRAQPRDVNVNISLDGATAESSGAPAAKVAEESDASHEGSADVSHGGSGSKTPGEGDENAHVKQSTTCTQCGETVAQSHVYCPNCGEKSSRRVFCECGDELRSDWAFCPGCGRRTAAADVLDNP
jgi:hypothetical protein